MEQQKCIGCRATKSLSAFMEYRDGKDREPENGLDTLCMSCRHELEEKRRLTSRLKKYGLSYEKYREMERDQGYVCAICNRRPETLFVDHCHKTDKVRGLLCPGCNWGLGHFGDSRARLAAAQIYLREAEAKNE